MCDPACSTVRDTVDRTARSSGPHYRQVHRLGTLGTYIWCQKRTTHTRESMKLYSLATAGPSLSSLTED